MKKSFVKTVSFLRLFAGVLVFGFAAQTPALCENVTHKNNVTISIISPRDSSLWVGTASRGLLRVGVTGRPFVYSSLTGHLECDAIVSLAFDENGLLWIRDGRDSVLTYSTLEGFVQRSEIPASVRSILFEQPKEAADLSAAEPVVVTWKTAIWPWILAVVCLVAVIAFLLFYYFLKLRVAPVSPVKVESKPAEPEEKRTERPAKVVESVVKTTVADPELFQVEDSDFEAKVKDIIEKNYTDKDFSVEQIAAELGISRVHLTRKLKALAAPSPSDMIKARRMEAAAGMLRSGEKNKAVIAASCGFASGAYFSTAFKAFYGVSPSDFE